MTTSPRRKRLFGAVLVFALVLGFAGVASADEFSASTTTVNVTTSTTVGITLVALPQTATYTDGGTSDTGTHDCNVQDPNVNANNPQHVTASVTSGDVGVATVSPSTLTFYNCGESQDITITAVCFTAPPASKSTDVTIAYQSSGPGNSVKGVFDTETIHVTVPAAADCGTPPPITTCPEPAAPAWAAALLQASGLKAKAATNYISMVAHEMGPNTMFEGVPKSAVGPTSVPPDAYPNKVRQFLISQGLTIVSVADARVIRPGFACT